jgi:hypothetical protein
VNIAYPTESFFYPYHLLAGVIVVAIFAVILVCLFRFKKTHKKTTPAEEEKPIGNEDVTSIKPEEKPFGNEDAISMGTLIIALVASGIYPFLINPMMDYTVTYLGDVKPSIQNYKIDVYNWGLSPAKSVILSMTSDNTNFFNFTTKPFLGNLTRSNTSVQGNAMFLIPVLPPRSHTIVDFKADVSRANAGQQMTVFTRSDEKVGYHDVMWVITFYLILGIIMVLSFIILVFSKEGDDKRLTLKNIGLKFVTMHFRKKGEEILTLKNIGLSFIPISVWMVAFTVVYLILWRNTEHLANL